MDKTCAPAISINSQQESKLKTAVVRCSLMRQGPEVGMQSHVIARSIQQEIHSLRHINYVMPLQLQPSLINLIYHRRYYQHTKFDTNIKWNVPSLFFYWRLLNMINSYNPDLLNTRGFRDTDHQSHCSFHCFKAVMEQAGCPNYYTLHWTIHNYGCRRKSVYCIQLLCLKFKLPKRRWGAHKKWNTFTILSIIDLFWSI